MNASRRVAALGLLVLCLQGCGYALVGKGVTIDPSIKRIGVPLAKDASGHPGLDQKVTQKIIQELLKRGRFQVVQEATGVDALVECDIASLSILPVGFSRAEGDTGQLEASRYAVTLTARVKYSKTGQTEPIWASDAFTAREETDVGSDPESFFDRDEQVQDRLATDFARRLVAAMLEAF
jgi:Lipopolysaccharide-assembly